LSVVQQLDAVTGPYGYVRLLGDREEVDQRTDTLNRTVVDRIDQIENDARTIRLLAERVPVLAFVNSHFEGYAPQTVGRLTAALGGEVRVGGQRSLFGD
jgi:hypothetical protein